MKRILLTGAGGFVGHHALSHLLKNTLWDFVVLESFRHQGTSARLREVFKEIPAAYKRVRVITHDLQGSIDAVTSREIGEVDFIVNFASESHVDTSILNPRPFIENNVTLVLTLLEFARKQSQLKLFVQISTDEVYGPAADGESFSEWAPYLPSNPYSASKASQEVIAMAYWRTYRIPILITNTMNIIGERQDKEKFLPLVISSLRAGKPVGVHARKIDSRWIIGSRHYLHARNQADAILFLIENYSTVFQDPSYLGTRPPKVNISGEQELKNDELVALVARIMELPSDKSYVEYINVEGIRPGHDLRYALDASLLEGLGWKPPVPLIQSIERTVKWTLRNPEWLK